MFALSLAINALDRQLLASLQPVLSAVFHLTNAQYGYLIAGFSISYSVSAPLMGILLDRFGITPVAIAAIALWSIFGAATAFTHSFAALMSCRILLGFAEGAALPAAGKAYSVYLDAPERTLGTATNQLGLTVGAIAASLLAGALAHSSGWQISFLIAAALGLVWIPIWLLISRRLPTSTSVCRGVFNVPWWSLLKKRGTYALIVANLLTMPLYSLWNNWTTAYLVRECGLSDQMANLKYAWIPQVFATLGGFSGCWFALRGMRSGQSAYSSRFRVCLVAASALLPTAWITHAKSPSSATIAISFSFFLTVAISANVYAMALDSFGTEFAAFAFSLLTCVYGLMQTVISPQIGLWIDHHGFAGICLIGALTPLVGVAELSLSMPLDPTRSVGVAKYFF